jgi:hypothetical protein
VSGNFWTTKEIKTLREHYPKLGAIGCMPYLPGRTKQSIERTARRYKIRHMRLWTKEEDAILIRFYASEGAIGCARRLKNRTVKAIQQHAAEYLHLEASAIATPRFGSGAKNPRTKLDDNVVALLRVRRKDIWPGMTDKQIAAAVGISNRHLSDIVHGKRRKYAVLDLEAA